MPVPELEDPVIEDIELEEDDPAEPPDDLDDEDHGDGDPIRWVTVATFWKPTEAHIARIKLESEEIDCIITDENLISTDWFLANAAGGIKLQVPAEQAERAIAALQKASRPPEAEEPIFDGAKRCPKCGSERIDLERFSRKFAFISILLLGIPLPFFRKSMRCDDCGFAWPQEHS